MSVHPVEQAGSHFQGQPEETRSACARGAPGGLEVLLRLAVNEGMEVLAADLFDMEGVLRREGGRWRIYLNRQDSPPRQRFALAHLLGHFVLHRDECTEFVDGPVALCGDWTAGSVQRDLEANALARALVMPAAGIEDVLGGEPPDEAGVMRIAARFQVSPLAAATRLRELGYGIRQ